jgi:tripartite-type tricarboxylate transporter receptor subunit TctC
MTSKLRLLRILAYTCVALLASQAPALAQPAADFYRGKTISLYVGFPPGGGYDLYGRMMLPYFSKHIPGNPTIVIKNMLGGSGIRAAGYMSNATPQDGTSLGLFLDHTSLGKVLGGAGEFDPVKMVWIGRIVSTATVSLVWHTSPVQSVDEAKTREIIIAASVPSNSASFIPTALNDLYGTRFKVIKGFLGSPDQALAMQRGEVNAIGGISWEAVQMNHQDWLAEKKAKVLYALGARRLKALPNVPSLLDFAVDERARNILSLLGSGPDIGRSLVAEPGIPPERAAVLRRAFMATMEDPEFVTEMHKRNLEVEPLSGEEVQRIVEASAATPKDLVEQAKRYIGQ